MANLALPGNPRYQPKDLVADFGYDNLSRAPIEVELAALQTLGDMQLIPKADMDMLTPEVLEKLYAITTSAVDRVERTDTPEYGKKTQHDIRALVRIMQSILPVPLRRWVHVPLTSYDPIDTGRILQFLRAHWHVVNPKARAIIKCLRDQAFKYAGVVQIGRTHGQHALPVTVGFWFATVLSRVLFNIEQADRYASGLVGKISGAVGAYNAQIALLGDNGARFENQVLVRLGLKPAPISTQILPPEPLAYYLFSCLALSTALGQFGRDGRHLMRTEIAELVEPFDKGQVGSSTMAQKRNPINFEQLEGMVIKNIGEFMKVLLTMNSEHQRDLTGSAPARDFPTIIVNLVNQLDTLLRPGTDGTPFLGRITVDIEGCRRNLGMQGDLILAEPFYLLLQMHGYEGDAHEVINHKAVPLVGTQEQTLYEAVEHLTVEDPELKSAWDKMPAEVHNLLRHPTNYTGLAREKALHICERADAYLAQV